MIFKAYNLMKKVVLTKGEAALVRKIYQNPEITILIVLAPEVINTAKKIIPRNIKDANLNNISIKKLQIQVLKADEFKNEILNLLKNNIRFFKKIPLINCTERDEYLYFKDRRYVPGYKLL